MMVLDTTRVVTSYRVAIKATEASAQPVIVVRVTMARIMSSGPGGTPGHLGPST